MFKNSFAPILAFSFSLFFVPATGLSVAPKLERVDCQFLLVSGKSRAVNIEWLRVGAGLHLVARERTELEGIHRFFEDLVANKNAKKISSMKSPYIAEQFERLVDFSTDLHAQMRTAYNKLKKESNRDRYEAVLYLESAMPVVGLLLEAMDKTKDRNSYKNLVGYAYIIAGIESYSEAILTRNSPVGRVIPRELEQNIGVGPQTLLNSAADMANKFLKGSDLDMSSVAGLDYVLTNIDKAWRSNHVVIPVIGNMPVKVELAAGFLPVQFLRLPKGSAPNRVLDTIVGPGLTFLADLTQASDPVIKAYDHRESDLNSSRGEAEAISDAFTNWELLLQAAQRSPNPVKALALLHLIRYHDLHFDAEDFHPNWSDSLSIARYLTEHILIQAGGRVSYKVNDGLWYSLEQLEEFYQKNFGFKDDWTQKDITESLDAFFAVIADDVDPYYLNDEAAAALKEDPKRVFTVYLRLLNDEYGIDIDAE